MIGTVGIVSLIGMDEIKFAIKNVALFRTSQVNKFTFYLLCYLKSVEAKNYIEVNLAGSTQKYISLNALRKMPIKVIAEHVLLEINSLLTPIFENIILNVRENERLSQLRDNLLPKLMSGEIDVSEVQI